MNGAGEGNRNTPEYHLNSAGWCPTQIESAANGINGLRIRCPTKAATFGLLVAALFAVEFGAASPAQAATVRSYTPGGAPCAGACSYEWARGESGAPEGDPTPLIIPEGATVHWMSYAKGGRPYATRERMVLAGDEPGVGYAFTAPGGRVLHMVRIDACANWAIVEMPPVLKPPVAATGADLPALPPAVIGAPATIGAGYAGGVFAGGVFAGGGAWCDCLPAVTPSVVTPPTVTPPATPVAPVPLAAAGVFLLAALVSLALMGRRP